MGHESTVMVVASLLAKEDGTEQEAMVMAGLSHWEISHTEALREERVPAQGRSVLVTVGRAVLLPVVVGILGLPRLALARAVSSFQGEGKVGGEWGLLSFGPYLLPNEASSGWLAQ